MYNEPINIGSYLTEF